MLKTAIIFLSALFFFTEQGIFTTITLAANDKLRCGNLAHHTRTFHVIHIIFTKHHVILTPYSVLVSYTIHTHISNLPQHLSPIQPRGWRV
ncbi:hypothetical protein EON63_23070 [archaeon]|nr:MAG: hypothetical protein EON63_23070 [archaeon]